MGDRSRGLYEKFTITRTDGKDAHGEKHDSCEYFVLDLTHDPFAIPALRAYALACRRDYPRLCHDLLARVVELEDRERQKIDATGCESDGE